MNTKTNSTLSNKLCMAPTRKRSKFCIIVFKPSLQDLVTVFCDISFFSLKFSVQRAERQAIDAMNTGTARMKGATGPRDNHRAAMSAMKPATTATILLPNAT